jgi:hypothetical protein
MGARIGIEARDGGRKGLASEPVRKGSVKGKAFDAGGG